MFQSNSVFRQYTIPAAVISELEAVQPYHPGYEPLWKLHELANIDKHRLPLLVSAAANNLLIGLPDHNSQPTKSAPQQLQGQASIFVAWQDPSMPKEPVQLLMEKILESVADVVRRFDQLVL